jgi:hypothetical protein
MRASLLAYLVGVSAVIGIGIVGLMPVQSAIERATPSAPIVTLLRMRMHYGLRLWSAFAAASHKERLVEPVNQIIVDQKKARPNQKHAMVH